MFTQDHLYQNQSLCKQWYSDQVLPTGRYIGATLYRWKAILTYVNTSLWWGVGWPTTRHGRDHLYRWTVNLPGGILLMWTSRLGARELGSENISGKLLQVNDLCMLRNRGVFTVLKWTLDDAIIKTWLQIKRQICCVFKSHPNYWRIGRHNMQSRRATRDGIIGDELSKMYMLKYIHVFIIRNNDTYIKNIL